MRAAARQHQEIACAEAGGATIRQLYGSAPGEHQMERRAASPRLRLQSWPERTPREAVQVKASACERKMRWRCATQLHTMNSITSPGVHLKIAPFSNGFGADVLGVDPHLQLDDDEIAQVRRAWHLHSILRFRRLEVTPDEHTRFSRRLGKLHIMTPLKFNLEGYPEVFVVSNASKRNPDEPVGKSAGEVGLRRAGEGFHTDGEDKAIPNAGSMLYAAQVPPEKGDTLFVDMYAAYEALPSQVKSLIAGRRARYSRIDLHPVHYPHMDPLTPEQKLERPDVFHPLARAHPYSGRTALYIGRWACDIEGLPVEEGRALIRYLQDFAKQPKFIYTQKWQKGDAILWDNRCTQHCATGFDDERYVRTMYRTTLEGETPLMARTPVRLKLEEFA
ncbi:TauD/TfdA dioxygenase family protein [Variovorax sp. PBL-E5]|uniref:TauD/TfdA dioxygenase family protein n=1 Tax=Variovorax sp. PBL-E5 TaxID=434014 RepID=UPI001E4B7960|nr:TauD/TfdA family dioxygenase [Variovorax sp. PBL-E5]